MNYFIATILTKGKKEQIPIYAENKKLAHDYAKIKYNGIIIKVVEAQEPFDAQLKRFKTDLLKNIKKSKIKPDAQIAAIRQLAVMTNAGISIYDSLANIADATEDTNLKIVFSKLADDINSGHALSSSMENFRFELGNLSIAMVQLGEKTGNLDESLYSLANMLEEIRANVVKFKKAMAYPRNVMRDVPVRQTRLCPERNRRRRRLSRHRRRHQCSARTGCHVRTCIRRRPFRASARTPGPGRRRGERSLGSLSPSPV